MGSSPEKPETASRSSPTKTNSKMHRRSRSGCFTCRLRRKKCDEGRNKCKACRHLGLECEYKRPVWWSNNDTRRKQKELIKTIIKRTKSTEKSTSLQSHFERITPPLLSQSMPTSEYYSDIPGRATRASTPDSQEDYVHNFDQSFGTTPNYYDPYASIPVYAPQISHAPHSYIHPYSYEVDVKTERQMFINDVPTRRDSTISTFSTCVPPHAMLPSYSGDDWTQPLDYYGVKQEDWTQEEGLDFNFFDFSHTQQPFQAEVAQSALIPVEDDDRELLDYMLNNVLRLLFPVLEANQHGSVRSEVILPALESNKAYLHSCLNAAAVHQKATKSVQSPNIDSAILQHKYAFVNEVVTALSTDTQHVEILEATLGMIALQGVVGHADEQEKDIPWHQHFQAATELVSKLNLPSLLENMVHGGGQPPFNMTLTAWIDILGSTMLGRSPTFANTYRNKHLSGSVSGLAQLMGCNDSVMYLLSEVACLDSLKVDNKLDDLSLCQHITSLGHQIDATEPNPEVVQSPYSRSGALRPKQLSKNITAIFRKAARVYLCSLVPTYTPYQHGTCALIAQMTEWLQFIPAGPDGFDRALVWPLLICGANSIPTSPFRRVLAERVELLGDEADHGSFGRMVRLLHEVWRCNDEIAISAGVCEATPITAGSPGGSVSTPIMHGSSYTPSLSNTVSAVASSAAVLSTSYKTQNVHWRDVMQQNGWDYLLI